MDRDLLDFFINKLNKIERRLLKLESNTEASGEVKALVKTAEAAIEDVLDKVSEISQGTVGEDDVFDKITGRTEWEGSFNALSFPLPFKCLCCEANNCPNCIYNEK